MMQKFWCEFFKIGKKIIIFQFHETTEVKLYHWKEYLKHNINKKSPLTFVCLFADIALKLNDIRDLWPPS